MDKTLAAGNVSGTVSHANEFFFVKGDAGVVGLVDEKLLSVTEISARSYTVMRAHIQLWHSGSTYQSIFNGDGTQANYIGVANYFKGVVEEPMTIWAADY